MVDDGSGSPPGSFFVSANVAMTITTDATVVHSVVVAQVATAIQAYISSLSLVQVLTYTQLAAIAYGVSPAITNVFAVLLNGSTADLGATPNQVIRPGHSDGGLNECWRPKRHAFEAKKPDANRVFGDQNAILDALLWGYAQALSWGSVSIKRFAMLLPLGLLLTACVARQTALPLDSQPVKPAAIPVLPLQGRQLPVTPLCSPTCSSALTNERAIWQQLLTKPEPGA